MSWMGVLVSKLTQKRYDQFKWKIPILNAQNFSRPDKPPGPKMIMSELLTVENMLGRETSSYVLKCDTPELINWKREALSTVTD